jgi:N-acylglucosamine-6-phosphate 2-epimerase
MGTRHSDVLETIKDGLVVSCQAHGDHPFRDTSVLVALARCAERGGAAAIRADGPEDISRISRDVSLPVIGIYKVPLSGERFFITPEFGHAAEIVDAGASAVALEATRQNRPDDRELESLIRRIRGELGVPVMADISTVAEGLRAQGMGADLVATTLSGYTRESPPRETPDYELVSHLAGRGVRVVAEGHVRTPRQVGELFERGSYSVVVGTAITDPVSITSWFVKATEAHAKGVIGGGGE